MFLLTVSILLFEVVNVVTASIEFNSATLVNSNSLDPCRTAFGEGWHHFNENCYLFCTKRPKGVIYEPLSFEDAEEFCLSVESNLASVHSQSEHKFLHTKISWLPSKSFWIGYTKLRSPTNQYYWTDGTQNDFVKWLPNEPSDYQQQEKCAYMRKELAGLWNDENCKQKFAFICKKPLKRLSRLISRLPPRRERNQTTNTVPLMRPRNQAKILAPPKGHQQNRIINVVPPTGQQNQAASEMPPRKQLQLGAAMPTLKPRLECPKLWFSLGNDNNCYGIVEDVSPFTWEGALYKCRELGESTNLLKINSEKELNQLREQLQNEDVTDLWIGMDVSDRIHPSIRNPQHYSNPWSTSSLQIPSSCVALARKTRDDRLQMVKRDCQQMLYKAICQRPIGQSSSNPSLKPDHNTFPSFYPNHVSSSYVHSYGPHSSSIAHSSGSQSSSYVHSYGPHSSSIAHSSGSQSSSYAHSSGSVSNPFSNSPSNFFGHSSGHRSSSFVQANSFYRSNPYYQPFGK